MGAAPQRSFVDCADDATRIGAALARDREQPVRAGDVRERVAARSTVQSGELEAGVHQPRVNRSHASASIWSVSRAATSPLSPRGRQVAPAWLHRVHVGDRLGTADGAALEVDDRDEAGADAVLVEGGAQLVVGGSGRCRRGACAAGGRR